MVSLMAGINMNILCCLLAACHTALTAEGAVATEQCWCGSKVVELEHESDGSDIQAALAKLIVQRTMPNVFIGGQHIGGCDDTSAMHKKGKLVPLLKDAGAVKLVTM